MLAGEVTELPIDHDIPLPPLRRSFSPRRSLRMQTLITCEGCHSAPVIKIDTDNRFGRKPSLSLLCADCRPAYQIADEISRRGRGDCFPFVDSAMGLQEYQQETRGEPSGEQRLAAAMIHNAAADIWRDGPETRSDSRPPSGNRFFGSARERLSAFRWLYGDLDGGLSFTDCCAYLGIDAESTRRMIFLCGDRFTASRESKRVFVGNYVEHPAVDRDVPVLEAPFSLRSNPRRRIEQWQN